ncbi:hypothetical protein NKH19_17790 [Mesorhizobium sp. M1338]|uniref:hypothetical protein n=1 Tax=Mesorhizobium sp. M1338 TaxID=2957085 RepID=UPI003334C449
MSSKTIALRLAVCWKKTVPLSAPKTLAHVVTRIQLMKFGRDIVTYIERQRGSKMGSVDGKFDAAAFPNHHLGDAGADPVVAPISYDDPSTRLHLVAQNLPRIDDLNGIVKFQLGQIRRCTGCHDYGIGRFLFDQCMINPDTALDLNLVDFKFAREIGNDSAEFCAAGQKLRQSGLPS